MRGAKGKRLNARERATVAKAAALAAGYYRIFRPMIFRPTRCKIRVTAARQVAIYLAHCAGGIPMNRLTIAFGRDLSTISHNIQLIEDARDRPEFDAMISGLESEIPSPGALAGNV